MDENVIIGVLLLAAEMAFLAWIACPEMWPDVWAALKARERKIFGPRSWER